MDMSDLIALLNGLIHPSGPCADAACVDITLVESGFEFTSTIDGNEGSVTYTAAEVAEFLADVKAGKWDALHRTARELAENEPAIA